MLFYRARAGAATRASRSTAEAAQRSTAYSAMASASAAKAASAAQRYGFCRTYASLHPVKSAVAASRLLLRWFSRQPSYSWQYVLSMCISEHCPSKLRGFSAGAAAGRISTAFESQSSKVLRESVHSIEDAERRVKAALALAKEAEEKVRPQLLPISWRALIQTFSERHLPF